MGSLGFKSHISLVLEPGAGARLVDSQTQRTLSLTPTEGRLLALLMPGCTPESLSAAARGAGLNLEPSQIDALLARLSANGFLDGAPVAGRPSAPVLLPDQVVPAFRADLQVAAGSNPGLALVTDPQRDRSFTLYDFEVHICRLLDGRHRVTEVIALAAKIGIPMTPESLSKFIGQMRAYGFISDGPGPAADEASSWPSRDAWSSDARELYQSALRLFRQNRPQQALEYLDALLEIQPDTAKALELRARVLAHQAEGQGPDSSFEGLHGEPAGAPTPLARIDLLQLAAPSSSQPGASAPNSSAPSAELARVARVTTPFGRAQPAPSAPVTPAAGSEVLGPRPSAPGAGQQSVPAGGEAALASVASPPAAAVGRVAAPAQQGSPAPAEPPAEGLSAVAPRRPAAGAAAQSPTIAGGQAAAAAQPRPSPAGRSAAARERATGAPVQNPAAGRAEPTSSSPSVGEQVQVGAPSEHGLVDAYGPPVPADLGAEAPTSLMLAAGHAAEAPVAVPPPRPSAPRSTAVRSALRPERGLGRTTWLALVAVVVVGVLVPVRVPQRLRLKLSPVVLGEPHIPAAAIFGELKVDNGAHVDEGEVVATLDTRAQLAQLGELRQSLARLEAATQAALAMVNPVGLRQATALVARSELELDAAKARLSRLGQRPRPRPLKLAQLDVAKWAHQLEQARQAVEAANGAQRAEALHAEVEATRAQIASLEKQTATAFVTAPVAGVFLIEQVPPAHTRFAEVTGLGLVVDEHQAVLLEAPEGQATVVLGGRRLSKLRRRPEGGLLVPLEEGQRPEQVIVELAGGWRPWPLAWLSTR